MQQLNILAEKASHKPINTEDLPDVFADLSQVQEFVRSCRRCALCRDRNNVVFFRGNPDAKLMVIGEGPGQQEDLTGLPFVGKAGQLLDKILASAGIDKDEEVYICNVVKCRPPGNRVPSPEEMEKCRPFLNAQISFIKPKLILLAGATALQAMMKSKDPISRVRGKWFPHVSGARVMPVFHPSYLLRNDSREVGSPKWLMWQDIKEVARALREPG
jgi:uracil-DNA glycosylase